MLSKPSLDKESRLEVIYRILKEQLKKAKSDLLEIKKNRDKEQKAAEELKIKIKLAQQKAGRTKDNVTDCITEKVNEKGEI